jgi:hypothetical protein
MKKAAKKLNIQSDNGINIVIDDRLNKINVAALAPKKLAEANKHLRKMKFLPK